MRAGVRRARPALIAALVVAAAAACGSGEGAIVAGQGDFSHVHDLVVDDDGALLAATHTGLYRIEAEERAVLVGTGRHDLMALARGLDGGLIASGHPDLSMEEYRVEGLPPHFGLVESTDWGRTWTGAQGLGEADFHALAPSAEGVYAAEAAGSVWLLPVDGDWQRRGAMEARDLAVMPGESNRQVATDFDGVVWTSEDAASSWFEVLDTPPLVEIEWPTPDRLYALDGAGTVWSSPDHAGPWARIAQGPSAPETFLVDGSGSWWVASEGGTIARSEDSGETWDVVYRLPERP